MQGHLYLTHPTYTGPGCCVCGKSLSEHAGATIESQMTKEEYRKRYPSSESGRTEDERQGNYIHDSLLLFYKNLALGT